MLSSNITESALICAGQGKIKKVVINSHNAGTLKLVDGFTAGAVATTILTSSGAMVPADYATNTLTSTGTAVADGDTVTINTTVYTAKTALSNAGAEANEVLIGSTTDGSAFLANLKKAINLTGTAGTDYGIRTVQNPDVIAEALGATTLKVWARTLGTVPNTYATTENSSQLSWADTTLGGGTGASDPGVTAAGATITLDQVTYTGVLRLAETLGMTSVPNQVLWVTSESVFLDNIKSAVNRVGTPGTDYSSATTMHPTVFATTNTATQQTFNAKLAGTAGNSIATTKTMANYAFTSTVMASGTLTTSKTICNTITFSAVATTGERIIDFGDDGIDFTTGLLAVVGGTAADLTLIYEHA